MRTTFLSILTPVAVAAAMIAGTGCETAPKTAEKRDNLHDRSESALKVMRRSDSGVAQNIDSAYGYAIFPDVGKGGLIAGGAYGRGLVYEQGRFIGYSDMKQATVGLQAGGQTFHELILFQNQDAFNRFRADDYAFAANASAVALKPGASKSLRYDNGVGVYTMPVGGVMFEAAVGGQRFTFITEDRANRKIELNEQQRQINQETKQEKQQLKAEQKEVQQQQKQAEMRTKEAEIRTNDAERTTTTTTEKRTTTTTDVDTDSAADRDGVKVKAEIEKK